MRIANLTSLSWALLVMIKIRPIIIFIAIKEDRINGYSGRWSVWLDNTNSRYLDDQKDHREPHLNRYQSDLGCRDPSVASLYSGCYSVPGDVDTELLIGFNFCQRALVMTLGSIHIGLGLFPGIGQTGDAPGASRVDEQIAHALLG